MFNFSFDGNAAPHVSPKPFKPTPSAPSAPSAPPHLVPASEWPVKPKRISYSYLNNIPRRDLFDVEFELKARRDLSPEEQFLLTSHSDLEQNVYEGGLKVWEGAVDLAQSISPPEFLAELPTHVSALELGCGGALPLCTLLSHAISHNLTGKFVFADYNRAVLDLLTFPNVVLTWLHATNHELVQNTRGELELGQDLVNAMLTDLTSRQIEVQFVYGGWGREFAQLVGQFDVVLASETIYSLDSLMPFTDVVEHAISGGGKAFIAAKRVYFGVGGGVIEFEQALDARSIQHAVVAELGSVQRVVLSVYL